MNESDVVLAPLPQAAGPTKNRPAIVLRTMPPYGDLLVCGVSTQLRQEVAGFDDPIGPGDPDYGPSGLKAPSLIRLGFLAVLPATGLLGAIGTISKKRHERLLDRLCNYLRPAPAAQKPSP
ncbi:MAG: type II toxin-antitoxin system PemK/MazF family toxin [Planctomycetes bacterium]|nr:type II toxin-antitoxin system PemK/MazF family toxin [Planctomycetota bacterium]